MKKYFLKKCRTITFVSVFSLLTFLVFLSPGVSEGATRVIKMGSNTAISLPYNQAGVKLAEIVKEKSNGRIEIQWFGNGQLGNEQELLQGMAMGTTDMSLVIGGTYANVIPEFSVIGMAYCFRDPQHMKNVMRGEVGNILAAASLKKNIRLLDSSWWFGTRHLTSNKPVTVPDDLKGMKIRVVPASVYITSWRVLGAIPTPVEWGDIYVALKTNMVDGQENPLSNIRAGGINQVNKYLHLSGHVVANVEVAMSENLYKALTPEDRKIIQEAISEAGQYNEQLVEKSNKDDLLWLKGNGMQQIAINVGAFMEKAKEIPKVFENGKWLDLYNKIQAVK